MSIVSSSRSPAKDLRSRVGQNDRQRRRRGCAHYIGDRRRAPYQPAHQSAEYRRQPPRARHRRPRAGHSRTDLLRPVPTPAASRPTPKRRDGVLRTRRPTARAAGALGLRPLALVVLLATTLGVLALGDIAKHTARARAHRLQIQTQQVGNLDKVRIDHIAIAQRIDERQCILERLGATARRGNVARLLQ